MRLIDADALKHMVESMNFAQPFMDVTRVLYGVGIEIDNMPTIDAVSVVHGRWRRKMVDDGFNIDWVCSKCGYRVMTDFVSYNYCPNCGAKMDGERKESE